MEEFCTYTYFGTTLREHMSDMMPGSVCQVGYPKSNIPNLCVEGGELLGFMNRYLKEHNLKAVYSRKGYWSVTVPAPEKEDLLAALQDSKIKGLEEDVSKLRVERISLLVDLEAARSKEVFLQTVIKAIVFIVVVLLVLCNFPGGI